MSRPDWERDGADWPNREASEFVTAAGHRWLRVCAVDAEEAEEVAERCEVTAVPLAQLWVRGAKVREVRGADADAVRELLREGEEKVAASSA